MKWMLFSVLFFTFSLNAYSEESWPCATSSTLSHESFVLGGYSVKLPMKIESIHALTAVSLAVKYSENKKLGLTLLRNDGEYLEEFPVPNGVSLTNYFDLLYSTNTQAYTQLADDRHAFLPELSEVSIFETADYKAIMATIKLESFNRRLVIYRKSDPTTVLDVLASNVSSEQIQNIISSFSYKGL